MDRRGFLGSILAACAAPAIVRADSLMRVVSRDTGILTVKMGATSAKYPEWEVDYLPGFTGTFDGKNYINGRFYSWSSESISQLAERMREIKENMEFALLRDDVRFR